MDMRAPKRDERSSATLTIDLDAIAANYSLLREKCAPAICGAVVKADAYGLGVAAVARRLAGEGCRHFFVAHPGEGVALRDLPDSALDDANIYVLGGLCGEPASMLTNNNLVPALPTLGDIEIWRAHARRLERRLPAVLHFDTGINRLGIPIAEATRLVQEDLASFDLHFIMSHLACADEPGHLKNQQQLQRFADIRARFADIKGCLANSSGIYLGALFHHDLVRPGYAIYGGNPTPGLPNPMRCVLRVSAPVLQVRALAKDDTVGYGATFRAGGPMRAATIGVGYADGYPRALTGRGTVFVAGRMAPLLGRVSMDLATFDATDIPEALLRPGTPVELIGPSLSIDEVARMAGTIGYEILTMLGPRYKRVYGAVSSGEQTT